MKILGMGNALVDILTQLNDDSVLTTYGLPKGSMTLVDREMSNLILTGTSGLPKKKASGGSAANTIHGLANLGLQTAFIGKVGNDELGNFFRSDMQVNNIFTILYNSVNETGRAIALISPDTERTFATYLGASVELAAEDLSKDIFEAYDIFYIEGYLIQNKELIEKSLKLAKNAGLKICLDLASYNVVNDNIDFLNLIIAKYVDIVFANEEEAKVLTGYTPDVAVNILSAICEIAVIKTGAEGSLIKSGKEFAKIKPIPSNPIDTTGAGDLYAAGFLYGLSKKFDLETCGFFGSFLAGKVIEILGAKMEKATWKMIRKKVAGDSF